MFMLKGKKYLANKAVFWWTVLLAINFYSPVSVIAADIVSDKKVETTEQAHEEYSAKVKDLIDFLEGRKDSFVYNRTGRPDPFMPFIKEKTVTADVKVPEHELSGLQKFEPGQLSLVAIVVMQNEPRAMVEDSLGIGYIIKNGTEIGRTGIVDSINRNTVVVKQSYMTTAGEKRYKFLEMLLKKEGEK